VFSTFANNHFDISEIWKIFIGKNPNGGMWYLWALFIISIVFLLISQLSRKASVFIAVGLAMYAAYLLLPPTFMDSVLSYSVYYAVGILLQQNYEKVKSFFDCSLGMISAVISGICFIGLVTFADTPYLLTCLLASFSLLVLSCLIVKKNDSKVYRVLNELGNYSYDLYLISYFVQVPIRVVFYRIIPLPYWIVVTIMFILGTIIPYIVCKHIIRKIPIANRVLLGNLG
jgi:peptidoglycan/LPS O-acetylase OafA/YrhL